MTDARSNLERLRRLTRNGFPDVLVVPHRASADTLAEHGIRADVVPIGSGPRHCVDLGLERNIDVLFLGELRVPRRRRLLRRLCRIGLDVTAVGDWSNPAFFGEGRARLLNRSKILLNLGRFPGQMASHRFVLGMGAGALVVSEPVYGPEPFVPSEHFVSATLDELPSVVDHFLADEPERAAIAQRAPFRLRGGHDGALDRAARGARRSATLTRAFPRFSPLSIPMKARGALSRPSVTCSRQRIFPLATQCASLRTPSS